jgi:hypothetical protein
VYPESFEKVWRATQKSMAKFPLQVNNVETGQIETEVLRGSQRWSPPHQRPKNEPGLRTQMLVKLIAGQNAEGRASTEVAIEKRMTLEKNFFAQGQLIPSDGLEEDALFYRIERELTLERGLDRAFEP